MGCTVACCIIINLPRLLINAQEASRSDGKYPTESSRNHQRNQTMYNSFGRIVKTNDKSIPCILFFIIIQTLLSKAPYVLVRSFGGRQGEFGQPAFKCQNTKCQHWQSNPKPSGGSQPPASQENPARIIGYMMTIGSGRELSECCLFTSQTGELDLPSLCYNI